MPNYDDFDLDIQNIKDEDEDFLVNEKALSTLCTPGTCTGGWGCISFYC